MEQDSPLIVEEVVTKLGGTAPSSWSVNRWENNWGGSFHLFHDGGLKVLVEKTLEEG